MGNWLRIGGAGIVLVSLGLFIIMMSSSFFYSVAPKFLATIQIVRTTNASTALNIGNQAFGARFYDVALAEQAFRKAVEIEPGILWGHYQLARVLFVQGKLDEALAEINKELEYNPSNVRALYVRALVYAYQKKLPESEVDFKNFIAWIPTEWAGYNDLAWVLAQQGKYEEAKTVLKDAFKKASGASSNPWLWNNLGVQELNLKEFTAASVAFEKAHQLALVLDERTWREAYPGNAPETAAAGIEQFRAAITENLAKTTSSL